MSARQAFEAFADKLTAWQRADRKLRKRARRTQDADYFLSAEFDDVARMRHEAHEAFRVLLSTELSTRAMSK